MSDTERDELGAIKRRKMQEYERKRTLVEKQAAAAKNVPLKPNPENDLPFIRSKLLGLNEF